ncbi:metal-dependent hydrolase family protein [Phytoactinopolyspora limicola]|uniref:metal-dependent hydrolase family protein n=1 Tax=Phytoactinopolyspora limicola TaxID=2715536 RepID=UPI0014094EAD|nr:amidohydrolase family protein [Phytoactinopolyspora limicola]
MRNALTRPGQGAALVDCAIWDGRAESAVGDQGLRVAPDGTVRSAGPVEEILSQARADGDVVVELSGATLTPGLVNMHVHLGLALPGPMEEANKAATDAEQVLLLAGNAREVLRAGVTTVRLVGESRFADMALRAAIRRGQVDGPTIYTAGHALCCTGGHGHGADAVEADGADGFRRATREQIRAGADLIKVCISGGIAGEHEQIDTPQLTDDEMAAVISTAHDWGRKVTAHAGPAGAISRAVELGLDCVEHGYQLDAALCARMAERGVAYCPTITVSRCEQFFLDTGVPRWMIERALAAGPRHWESLQHAIAAGVPIIMGTDLPPQVPYDETTATVREMEFMAEAGMTAHAVMVSATSAAADWLGAGDDCGTLRPGARADVLLMEGDPTTDVSVLRSLHGVIQGGRIVRDDRGLLRTGGVV